jgi:AmiR/NasT family two-component response regulator
LSIPLVYKKKLVGVFNVQHKQAHTFTKRELQLLESIAHAAAGAIEHARLIEENMVLSETLQSRKTIDRAKGKLMKHNELSEAEAYEWLKKRAMDLRKSMKDVAEAVLISME